MKGKKRYFKCICDYYEDDIRYWKEGHLYRFHKHKHELKYRVGKYYYHDVGYYYDVETELGTWGGVGVGYMIGEEDIEKYFEVVWL